MATARDDPFFELCRLASQVGARRVFLQREIARGFEEAKKKLALRTAPTGIDAKIPGGMLEALAIAGALGRDTKLLDAHYTRSMPSALARQLAATGVLEEKLFTHRLSLARMPRLHRGLDGLFSLVSGADLDCEVVLGAASPARLLQARPTLAALFAGCHFGSSMPMLYAAPGDVSALQAGDLEAWIDARYAGPLAHELAHLQPIDPSLVPAPGNLHEALAAWLGSEAFPEQLWPREKSAAADPGNIRGPIQSAPGRDPGGLDALPGGGFFGSVGGWLARAISPREAIRAQAGALDLTDALGIQCASALRIYGWLPYLETSAPHLLADTFSPARWWKLVDLHRDPTLAAQIEGELVRPLLEDPPPPLGLPLVARWNKFLDALDWQQLPAWSDSIGAEDQKLAIRACRSLGVRAVRQGGSFRSERANPPPWPTSGDLDLRKILGDGPLRLDLRTCTLRTNWPGPDAVGAPPVHPVPPNFCARYLRAGFEEVRASFDGLPSLVG